MSWRRIRGSSRRIWAPGERNSGVSMSPLVEKLYCEIAIACDGASCTQIFLASEEANDPVEAWAMRAAKEARRLGWLESTDGRVLCPIHASGLSTDDAAL
jgi:hypothetical protein